MHSLLITTPTTKKEMTKAEIITEEAQDPEKITLYKEGVFWKAYNKSAYAFNKNIKEYKTTTKLITYCNYVAITIGFPTESLNKIKEIIKTKEEVEITEESDSKITLKIPTVNSNEFKEWKKEKTPDTMLERISHAKTDRYTLITPYL